jgi:divalent metal cation (Fe/Co/Zn/Cd) transporter
MVIDKMAGAVLLGLLLNALFGWWWADPLASLVIIYYGVREAVHALHESAQMARPQAVVEQEAVEKEA